VCVVCLFVRYFAILSKGWGDGVSAGKWCVLCVCVINALWVVEDSDFP
jgi:hypothetical protein